MSDKSTAMVAGVSVTKVGRKSGPNRASLRASLFAGVFRARLRPKQHVRRPETRMALPEDETPWISRGLVFGAEAPRTRRRNSAPWFLGNALHPFAKPCEAIDAALWHKRLPCNGLGTQEVPFVLILFPHYAAYGTQELKIAETSAGGFAILS